MQAEEIAELSRAIVESPAEAVVYADREGLIRFWNAGAERIFGFSSDEAIAQSLDLIIPEKLRGRHWEAYDRVMAGGESHYAPGDLLSVPGQTKSGERVSIEFTVVPIEDEHGGMAGIAAVLRDATSRFEELKRLRKQVEALQQDGAAS